jgi:LacI family transcriptional regulator
MWSGEFLTARLEPGITPETFSEGRRRIATIRELARLSGVSVATVSRVLNGYVDVSEATRERVLKLAREIDYTPSAAARTLVMQRSQVIGVILETGEGHPDLQHPFFQEVLVGLKHRIGASGYDLLLFATEIPGNGFADHSILRRARHHRVDGVVVMGVDSQNADIQKLARSPIPCVAVDLDLVGRRTGYVISDNLGGARLAVRHLHELGHHRIAIVTGMLSTRPGSDRLLGYRAELEALGLPYRDDYVREGDFYYESGYRATQELLDLETPPTAVFAAGDLMAAGCVRAAEERGVQIPGDVALVGFDDIQLAGMMQPALTTVRQDKMGLGATAADALLQMIEQTDAVPPIATLPVELVVRESSGARHASRRAPDTHLEEV